jgi:hypothetical protein
VGETGGKDFVFAHKSADIDVLVTALIRGAYEYAGQKAPTLLILPALHKRLKNTNIQDTENDVAPVLGGEPRVHSGFDLAASQRAPH